MKGACKIFRLRTKQGSTGNCVSENPEREAVTLPELYVALAKTRNVVDTMEKEWQSNHSSPVLMDHLYLLRNYLEFIRRYHEEN